MTIRRATLEDIPAIIPLAIRFNDTYYRIPLNLEKAVYVITTIIEDGIGFVSEGGFIGGLSVEDLMRDWTVLQEVAWYSEDKTGMKLLEAFIEVGELIEVDEIRLSTLATSSPIVGKLLERRGFAPFEQSYRLTGAGRWLQ